MKIYLPLVMALLLISGCSSSLKNPESNKTLAGSINLQVEEIKLENGMTALLVNNSKLPIFSLYLFYKVGSKNEIPGITGASHFLEHMMFKGAKKYGKNTFDFIIEGSGGSTNAYTTQDSTVYYENLPTNELNMILDIESDRMENLSLDQNDFEKERNVVLEERKMRYENSPKGQLYQLLMDNLFQGTPYGRSVIGDIPDLNSVSRNQIHDYFKRFYAPNNLVLVLVGDINLKKAKQKIIEKFGKIKPSFEVQTAHALNKDELFEVSLKKSKIVQRKGHSPHPLFMLAYPTFKAGHPKGYALDILSTIIGSGKSSTLVNEYVLTNKPVATTIYAGHQQLEKSGFFFISGELIKGIKIDQFQKKLVNRLKDFCEMEITDKNIQKVKNNYLLDLYASLDTNAGLAQFLGDRQLIFGDWKYYVQELENYEKVGVKEVKESCYETFSKNYVFVSVWKNHK